MAMSRLELETGVCWLKMASVWEILSSFVELITIWQKEYVGVLINCFSSEKFEFL